MPALVLLTIADFLEPEDTTRLRMTCRRLYDLLPTFLVMRGKDFSRVGTGTGWGDVEAYFDGPLFCASVNRLTVSVAAWKDQGWGNRKGELFVRLMRRSEEVASDASAPQHDEIIAERRDFFGLAEHKETSAMIVLGRSENVVKLARPGDWYRFMRRVGGGGGHRLHVTGFKAIATIQEHC